MRIGLIGASLCLCLVGISHAQNAHASIRKDLNVPSEDLSLGLQTVATTYEFQVLYPTSIVKDLKTSGAVGSLTSDEALRKVLTGTGLTYKFLDSNTITVYAAPSAPSGTAASTGSDSQTTSDAASKSSAGGGKKTSQDFRLAQVDQGKGANASSVGNQTSSEYPNGPTAGLEEIVVTAQKRSERLQDVPMSVTAISGEQIKNQGATDIKDLIGGVPGLSYSNQERGISDYTIRGIANASTTPTTGLYIDDISLVTTSLGGILGAFDPVLFDIARVEVLKGPQGTLYGGSAMGGAIKYVTAAPDLSKTSGYVSSSVGATQHGGISYGTEGVANLPLAADTVALRTGFAYLHEGGFIDNIPNGNIENVSVSTSPSPIYTPFTQQSLSTWDKDNFNSSDTYAGRVSLLWSPDPTWQIKPSALFQSYREANPVRAFANLPSLEASFRLNQPTSDQDSIYSLDINKDLSSIEISSISAYYARRLTWDREYSYLIGQIITPLFATSDSLANYPDYTKTLSEELRVSSKQPDSALQWLAGFYYSSQRDQFTPSVVATNSPFPNGFLFGTDQLHHTFQYATFGQVSYEFFQALEVTAGVRLFRIQQDVDITSNGPIAGGFSTTYGTSNEKGASPKFGVSYKLDQDHLLYASAARGFRPGAPNSNLVPPACDADLARLGYTVAPTSYRSDSLWSYELGSKNQFLGNQVLNGSLYYSDWKGLQQGIALPCGFGFTDNAGRATIKGAEFEAKLNLSTHFGVGAAGSFTDAHLVDATLGTTAFAGDQILETPRWIGSVNGTYSATLGDTWSVKARAEYDYRSRQRMSYTRTVAVTFADGVMGETSNPGEFQAGYGTANLSTSFSNGPTTVRALLSNVFDSNPTLDYQGTGQGYAYQMPLRPRTFRLELQQSF